MSNFTPLPADNNHHAKKIPFIGILVLVFIVVLILYFLSEIYKKTRFAKENPDTSKQAVVAVSPTPLPATVELKTEYQNPLDEKTQYVNPFSEYKNPFDELQ